MKYTLVYTCVGTFGTLTLLYFAYNRSEESTWGIRLAVTVSAANILLLLTCDKNLTSILVV